MMKAVLYTLASLVFLISGGDCIDSCPAIPTASFDPQDILGGWTAVWESTSPRLPCLNYNLTIGPDGNLTCKFLPYDIDAKAVAVNAQDQTKGFTVSVGFEKMNGASWNVFAFKKDTYVGIAVCKKTATVDYFSVTLWVRNGKTLSNDDVEEMKATLKENSGVVVSTFEKIRHDFLCNFINPVVKFAMTEALALLGFIKNFKP